MNYYFNRSVLDVIRKATVNCVGALLFCLHIAVYFFGILVFTEIYVHLYYILKQDGGGGGNGVYCF